MASGKTRLGMTLAETIGFSFADTDDIFEERYRIDIADFFQKYSEFEFRKIERQVLRDTGSLERTIIATGGGTPCFEDNMAFIKLSGTSIYLKWDPQILAERLKKSRYQRPILMNIQPGELEETIQRHLTEREHYYLQADYVYEGGITRNEDLIEWLKRRLEL
jgi:shikimate kinase